MRNKRLWVVFLFALVLLMAFAFSPTLRTKTVEAIDVIYQDIAFRGELWILGNRIELDVDGDTAITVDTDDQIDFEVNGSDVMVVTGTSLALDIGDLSLAADATGGNAGAVSEFIGLPRATLAALAAGTNGTTETAAYVDATPTGEWSEVDGGTNLVVSADTTYYKDVTNSVKIAFTDVITGEGVVGTAGAQDDLSSNESIGFWWRTSAATSSGDFYLEIDDSDGTDQDYDIPASVANVWQWVELDISGCDANCDTMDNIKILASADGAASFTTLNVYFDAMYKWDATDEEALGQAILADGVLYVDSVATAAGSANTRSILAEYTDYFVNYQSGSDVIVWITDQSATSNMAFIAY